MIEIKNASFAAGSFKLSGVNIEIPTGKYAVLIGKTGCGKTTILETVCGLKPIVSGTILIDNKDVSKLKASQRNIGFVPQDSSLFTNLSVFDNIAFSLKIRAWTEKEIKTRVTELAELLKIQNLLNRGCTHLSGGEKQRVALARALAFYPSAICLDEPLSALDEDTHSEICNLLKKVQNISNVSILHITHNKKEVEWLADITYKISENQVIRLEPQLRKAVVS